LLLLNSIRYAFSRPPIIYKYPDCNPKTAKNIALMLLKNEKFYIKVCHLMNLMSLDPPFEEDFLFTETFFRSEGIIEVRAYYRQHIENGGVIERKRYTKTEF